MLRLVFWLVAPLALVLLMLAGGVVRIAWWRRERRRRRRGLLDLTGVTR